MKIKIIHFGFTILFFALITNCAVVTSYGRMPEQDTSDKDVYYFTFWYNSFSGKSDIDLYAINTIEAFKSDHGYLKHMIVERYGDKPLLNKVIYKVKFWAEE